MIITILSANPQWNCAIELALIIFNAIKFDFSIKLCLLQVIFETSRLATIVNGVLRKTTHDMELNGGFFEWLISFL